MTTISVEELPANLAQLIEGMNSGESITVVNKAGQRKKMLIAVDLGSEEVQPKFQPIHDEWFEDWDRMAREIAAIWPKGQSAVGALSEMRR